MENIVGAAGRKSNMKFSVFIGILVGLIGLFIVGIPTDVIPNDNYIRMTPAGVIEAVLLALFSIALGIYAGTFTYAYIENRVRENKQMAGSAGKGTVGALGSWLTISCPTCVTLLVSIFGSAALMKYYDPIRPYLGFLSIGLISLGINSNISMIKGRCRTCRAVNSRPKKR